MKKYNIIYTKHFSLPFLLYGGVSFFSAKALTSLLAAVPPSRFIDFERRRFPENEKNDCPGF
ncbi:hypothetical protein AKJ16_DCAP26049 [Drosera capensis]